MDARVAAPLIASVPYAISDPVKRLVVGLSGPQVMSRFVSSLGASSHRSKEKTRPCHPYMIITPRRELLATCAFLTSLGEH
ncbi:hypothetical protein ACFXA4_05145 [Streptomyces sp. NPDC059442]|uniref:hypothetical protein n=1 Tax=Streptomyces sp. NPDC059442 TaxID=3346830 RepID=UPI0036C9167E